MLGVAAVVAALSIPELVDGVELVVTKVLFVVLYRTGTVVVVMVLSITEEVI